MEQELQQQIAQYEEDEIDYKFNTECLTAHNEYRALHDCPPLELSEKLATSAQKWANYLASIGYLKHSPDTNGKFGENVAMKMAMGSTEYKGSQATAQWYSEIEFYDFDGPENQSRCGHFSQVVWKGTTEAGFGKAISPDGKMFAVGHYSPPGNFMNMWRLNIPGPINGQIYVPSQEEIMGEQQQQQQQQQSIKGVSKRSDDPVGLLSSLESLDGLAPDPHDTRDRQVGKATRTNIVNGEKTVTVTVTFMRPDGSRYQVSKKTVTQREFEDAKEVRTSWNGESVIHVMRQRRNFSAPPTADAGEADEQFAEQFREEVLELHNRFRAQHGAASLRRSDSLTELANQWAASLCSSKQLSHSRPVSYNGHQFVLVGQNIAKRPAELPSHVDGLSEAEQLCYQWYSESDGFQFGSRQPDDIRGGHFTQMVWRSSEKMGVGRAVDAVNGDVYVACFYHPCGNVEGEFEANVLQEEA